MKLKQYIKLVCLASFTVTAASCLDLEPKADLGDNLVWNKADNFQLFANQFYGWLPDFSSAISDSPHSDYRSDLVCESKRNVYSDGTNTIPTGDGNYTGNYKHIYYTNLLLKNAQNFGDAKAIAVPVAEAKFFRAFSYFELVQLYGNVILLTEPIDLDSEKLSASRNDRSVVIDQVIKDLKEAAEDLPETVSEAGRLTKYAAYAMLSRVALFEGTWQKFHTNGKDATTNTARSEELLTIAKDAADKVISCKKYKLFYNVALGNESYRYMFTLEDGVQCNPANLSKADNTEYILMKRHRNGDKTAWNLTHGMVANACYLTHKLVDMYLCSDGLPTAISSKFKGDKGVTDEFLERDNRMGNNMLYHGQKYWNNDGAWRTTWTDADLEKTLVANVRSGSGYQNRKWGTEREVADYYESYDFPVIRYAEVLLNYAEAVCESGLGDKNLATKALNDIRKRAAHTNEIELTRENIRSERMVELAFENIRIWDLRRWRVLHTLMNNFSHDILVPMLDLREENPALIFIRKTTLGVSLNGPNTYSISEYYEDVPRNAINQMIQNP